MKKTINKLLFKGILILGEGTSCDGLLDKEKGCLGGSNGRLAAWHVIICRGIGYWISFVLWSFFNDDQD